MNARREHIIVMNMQFALIQPVRLSARVNQVMKVMDNLVKVKNFDPRMIGYSKSRPAI